MINQLYEKTIKKNTKNLPTKHYGLTPCDGCGKPEWGHMINEQMYYPELRKWTYRYLLLCHNCYISLPLSKITKTHSISNRSKQK